MQMSLFRIRTFSTAVIGGFFTRLGIGGLPFLLPLLYQIGLGLPPAVSGLLIMPQAFGAISMKFMVPRILERFNYRPVLLTNTAILGCFPGGGSAWLGMARRCADRLAGLSLWRHDVFAIHLHEYDGVCRHAAPPRQ